MSSPFCALAPVYDDLWDGSETGRSQRETVWRELDRLFRAGERVLDLGCGTGTDALHLAGRGVQVFAIDASPSMVAIARDRGVDAHVHRIEELATIAGGFDGAYSNFGAVNCVADLERVAADLARIVRPGGVVALCLMQRFCWAETLTGAIGKAFRRWRGSATWRGTRIYYPTARHIRRTFANHFDAVGRVSTGRGDHCLHIFRRRRAC